MKITGVAYLVTRGNTLGADPGILIQIVDLERLQVLYEVCIHLDPSSDEMYDETEHKPDYDLTEVVMSKFGFQIVGPWERSGGQWAASVTPNEDRR